MYRVRSSAKILLTGVSIFLILTSFFTIYCYSSYSTVISIDNLVDWSRHKVIVFESDDWGMCSWVPNQEVFDSISETTFINELGAESALVWAKSTLEKPADLENLFGLPGKVKKALP